MFYPTEKVAKIIGCCQRTVQNYCFALGYEKTGKIYIIDDNQLETLKKEISTPGIKKSKKIS